MIIKITNYNDVSHLCVLSKTTLMMLNITEVILRLKNRTQTDWNSETVEVILGGNGLEQLESGQAVMI